MRPRPRPPKLHGHTYKVIVRVRSRGWLDLGELKEVVRSIIRDYDHTNLGSMTAEEIAYDIRQKVIACFPKASNVTVVVWETPESAVAI